MSQYKPLPLSELQELEIINTFNIKVFLKQIDIEISKSLISKFNLLKSSGFYYLPHINRMERLKKFTELSSHSHEIGCRTLDILHVCNAILSKADLFVSYDDRQNKLAAIAGLEVWNKQ